MRDTNGQVKGRWAIEDRSVDEHPSELSLFNERGKKVTRLEGTIFGSGVEFFDDLSKGEASLGLVDGFPTLWLIDEKGLSRVHINVMGDVGPSLEMQDSDCHVRAVLDKSGLNVLDKDGFQTKIGLTSLSRNNPAILTLTSAASIILFDKDLKILWKAP